MGAKEEFENCEKNVRDLTSNAGKYQEIVNKLRSECQAVVKDREDIEKEFKKIQEDIIPGASCPPLSPSDDDTESWIPTGLERQPESFVGQKANECDLVWVPAQDTTDKLKFWTCNECNFRFNDGQTCVGCPGVGGFQDLDIPDLDGSDVLATHAAFRRLLSKPPQRQAADKT